MEGGSKKVWVFRGSSYDEDFGASWSRLDPKFSETIVSTASMTVPLPFKLVGLRACELGFKGFRMIVPLKYIEYGFGYTIIRSPYTPCSIYLL